MPIYCCKVFNQNQQIAKEFIYADSKDHLYQILDKKKLILIKFQKHKNYQFNLLNNTEDIKKSFFYLYNFIKNEINLIDAIEILIQSLGNSHVATIWRHIMHMIESGYTLYRAMSEFPNFFSRTILSIIMVGEKTGNLEKAFQNGYVFLDKKSQIAKQLKKTLRYPALVLAIILSLFFLMVKFIIPQMQSFANISSNHKNNLEYFLKFCNFLSEPLFYQLILILILLFYGCNFFKKTKFFKDYCIWKIPLISDVYRYYQSSKWLYNFATLIENEIDLLEALELSNQSVSNSYFRVKLDQVILNIEKGSGLFDALNLDGIIPNFALHMIELGEKTSNLPKMVTQAANLTSDITEKKISNILFWTEPLSMIIIGIIITLILSLVVLPIYDNLATFT
jgi:type II secretory pathway component PulF